MEETINVDNLINSLDMFTLSYIECALWASSDNRGDGDGGDDEIESLLDHGLWLEDMDPALLAKMASDCADFQAANEELLAKAGDPEQHGHDFWLTRCGHGAGFWDRGYGKVGDDLSEAAGVYGDVSLYLGDDEIVYGV